MTDITVKVGRSNVTVKDNLFESAIRTLSPERGLKRLASRLNIAAAAEMWKGASKTSRDLKKYNAPPSDPDSAVLGSLKTLQDRSSDQIRNNPIARGALSKIVTNVIGSGLNFQANIDSTALKFTPEQKEVWEDSVEREYRLHFEGVACHAARTLPMKEQQAIALMSTFERGDSFVVLKEKDSADSPYKLSTAILEGDMCSNPVGYRDTYNEDGSSLVEGVVKDTDGAPTDYWISNNHPGNMRLYSSRKWTKVPVIGPASGRRNILHIFRPTRPGQTRGYPLLSPVLEPLKQLERYTEAELMAAVISGMFTVFVKTETGKGVATFKPPQNSNNESSTADDYELGRGAMVNLKKDESIETANPGRPNAAFDPFVDSILKQVALGLEMPFETLMGLYLSSYSAARAALLDAWKLFKTRRDWFARIFCQPIYEAWLDEAISIGRISAPGYFSDPAIRKAYRGALWIGPARGMINEKDEVAAASNRIDKVLSTHQQETAGIGTGDWRDVMDQQAKEQQYAKKIGLILNKDDKQTEPPVEPSNNQKDNMED